MGLKFAHGSTARMPRGLSSEATETFHRAYVGRMEFGHYFRIAQGAEELWRWEVEFPLLREGGGVSQREGDAQEALLLSYAEMLRLTGLLDPEEIRSDAA